MKSISSLPSLDARLAAICDLSVPAARDGAGLHEYDGAVQDLSPDGVRRALAALGGPAETKPYPDAHDEAHAFAAEEALRVRFGDLELHCSNPLWHIENLDLSGYDRPYAPQEERDAARAAHLRLWPDAVDAAIEALDQVPAPLARATLPLARGLGEFLTPQPGVTSPSSAGPGTSTSTEVAAATRAHARLLDHLEHAVREGRPSAALGGAALARLLGSAEGCGFDLGAMSERVDVERDRLRALLDEALRRVDPKAAPADTARALRADHPAADELLAEFADLVSETLAWTARLDLVPHHDVEVLVQPMPEAQRRALAGLFTSAAHEPDGPSSFRISLPRTGWSGEETEQWLSSGFNRTLMPNMAIHEVAPGHASHGRALRRAGSDVRRTLYSEAFIEGWAHYCEEMALEEGFRDGDPRVAVAVAQDALRRVTRFACAIGLHTGAMTVADATARFERDVSLSGPAARHEAERGLFDPTYGRYTWGKFAILDLREKARARWGAGFTLRRFHSALFELGAPPLGLLDTVLERG